MCDMKRAILSFLLTALVQATCLATASDTIRINLDDAVALARTRSLDASVALTELRGAYWEWRTYRASLLPEITFDATLPSLSRQYSTYQSADGSYSYVRDDHVLVSGTLSVTQRLWATGATMSLSTSLDFMRQLGADGYSRFMSVPVSLTLNQPLFGFNDVKWSRKVEPVRYREACAQFMSASENNACTAVSLYFSLLMTEQDCASARANLDNARRMLESAKAKYDMGRISRNDMLQIEQMSVEAQLSLSAAESDARAAMFALRSFLGFEENVVLKADTPSAPAWQNVMFARASELANERNSLAQNIMRRQLEAEREVARAKGEMRQINIFASVGLTGTADRVKGAYRHPGDNEVVRIGVSLPLVDWGKRRGRVKVAQEQSRLVTEKLRKERMDFDQDLYVLVERANNQPQRLELARRAVEIAVNRYDAGVETFLIGKISTLDLSDAQTTKDSALRDYLSELYSAWSYTYRLRSLTLWDFATDMPVEADIARVLKQ